jgi:hypothetical protein
MPTDIAISPGNLPTTVPNRSRPYYLVTLVDVVHTAKGTKTVEELFIATDRPNFELGFISARGIYSDISEDKIIKGFVEIVAAAPKNSVLEMMFPTHRVKHIRSLTFNAVKPTMVTQ